ncbi:MAG: AlbA family DNA-binding domain-containing protein [Pseudonocardiaceae bacterium]
MALPDQELITLLADLESDRVERTESAANSDWLSEAICASANDMPGYGEPGVLFVGVSNNGAVLGQLVTDELLKQLAHLRDQAPSSHRRR